MIRRVLRWFDDRLGAAHFSRSVLNRVFPDHWSFMLGEIALYCLIVLIGTGVYLTMFFEPSNRDVVYEGSYEALRGVEMSAAYASALDLSFDVRAGLVMRQIHHWAALVFVAAILVHMLRVFFTGAFRRPRELNWMIGVALFVLSIANGFFGYSLLDDLLSGTGVRVANAIMLSIPLIGPWLAFTFFGGEFPSDAMIPRFFVLHVLILPAAIVALLSVHLGLVWRQKHTQFRAPGRTEENIAGSRLWPAYAMKSVGLFFVVAAVLAALGGLFQINPVWVYGPFRGAEATAAVTYASQPDWYMGWLDGALRLFPAWELTIGWFRIPNPFWPGVLLPTIVFTVLFVWPFLEERLSRDRAAHNLLDRPRDAPLRTAFGAGALTFVGVLFFAGSNDVLAGVFSTTPEALVTLLQWLLVPLPLAVGAVTWRICRELQRQGAHPVVGVESHHVRRTAGGGYEPGDGERGAAEVPAPAPE